MNKNTWLLISIILLAISRIIPHLPNFTPVLAAALFTGATFENKKRGILYLLMSLFLSDVLLQQIYGYGFHSLMVPIYLLILSILWLGTKLKDKLSYKNIGGYSLLGSTIFFVFSNLFVFIQGGYGYTINGFINCYFMALPFYGYQLLGDIFYNFIIFGLYFLVFQNYLKQTKV